MARVLSVGSKFGKALLALVTAVSLMPSMAWAEELGAQGDGAGATASTQLTGYGEVQQALAALLEAGDESAQITLASGFATADDALAYVGDQADDVLCHVMIAFTPGASAAEGTYAVEVHARALWDVASVAAGASAQALQASDASALAATLQAGWDSLAEDIDVSGLGITTSNATEQYYDALLESPEYFNVRTGLGYSFYSSGAVASISPYYITTDAATYATMKQNFDQAMAEAMALIDSRMTDLAKAYTLHDWLVNRASYDSTFSIQDGTEATAYGVMCRRMGVCQSYTFAYSALLKAAGISSTPLMVDSANHAWNLVVIDGAWYHVDVTWDDPVVNGGGSMLTHEYFLLSDTTIESMDSTHAGWKKGVSAGVYGWTSSRNCTSTKYEGRDWSSYDPTTDLKAAPTTALTATVSTTAVAPGKTATFACAVDGAEGATLTYQWQYSTNSGKTWKNSTVSGATTASMPMKATSTRAKYKYRCIVTANDGRTATSDAIGFATTLAASAKMTTTSVALNKTAKFKCTATGYGSYTRHYQWQYSKNGGLTWSNSTMTGATTATLSVKATSARKTQLYRCRVTAGGYIAYSNTVQLAIA